MKVSEKGLFIIESLEFDDEKTRREGRILRQILRLSGKSVKYLYIRTRKELGFALQQFERSKYRYLHISCHGNSRSISLSLDDMPFEQFAQEVRPYLKNRRLFFSACEVVNDNLAKAVLPNSGCYSIVGPTKSIYFDDAAVTWASFYHLVFRDGDDGLKGGKIRWILRRIRHMYGIELAYFRPSASGFVQCDIDTR